MRAPRLEVKTLMGPLELRPPAFPGERSAVSIFLAGKVLEQSLRQAIDANPLPVRDLLAPGQLALMPRGSVVPELINCLHSGRLVLATPGEGRGGDDPADRAWAAYDAFRAAFGREFSVSMRTHRLVSRERAADVRREADFDVVPAAEAAEIVLRLAKTRGGGALQAQAEVLSKAMVDLRGPAGGHGFVLLRAPMAQAARYVPPEDVITPAKLKQLKEEMETRLEVYLLGPNGHGLPIKYRLTKSDGGELKGGLDDAGLMKVPSLAVGPATIQFEWVTGVKEKQGDVTARNEALRTESGINVAEVWVELDDVLEPIEFEVVRGANRVIVQILRELYLFSM